MRLALRTLVGGLAVVGLIGALAACSTPATRTSLPRPVVSPVTIWTPAPTATSTAESALGTVDNPVRVAIVGDSLTAGGRRMLSQGLDQNTWMSYAQGKGVQFVGGFAKGGTTVQYQAAHVRPIRDVDVLVLMSGTNDVRLHIPFAKSAASYRRIVDVIRPKHVIVGEIPPYDRNPAAAAAYAEQEDAFVRDQGWTLTDPWRFARDGDHYVAGVSNDGIHPTTAGYKIVGQQFRDAILRSIAASVQG